jgi:hypothetical protein
VMMTMKITTTKMMTMLVNTTHSSTLPT